MNEQTKERELFEEETDKKLLQLEAIVEEIAGGNGDPESAREYEETAEFHRSRLEDLRVNWNALCEVSDTDLWEQKKVGFDAVFAEIADSLDKQKQDIQT